MSRVVDDDPGSLIVSPPGTPAPPCPPDDDPETDRPGQHGPGAPGL